MNKSFFIFIIVVLGVFCLGIVFAGASFLSYVDLASFFIVIVVTAALLVSTFKFREIGSYFKAAFNGSHAEPSTVKAGIVFFAAMQRYLILSAVVANLIGLIAILSTLGEPKQIGLGLALSLLTIFYAVIFILVLALPFRTSLERKLAEAGKS